jgi:hypothetical protein
MWFSSWMRKQISTRTPRSRTPHRLAAARFRPRLEALEDRWLPSQVGLTVSSLADSGPGTLRAAILAADAGSHSDQFTIGFGVAGTIDLRSPLPDLNNAIAVQGPGASGLTIQRDSAVTFPSAILTVDAGQTASLSGITIANGDAGLGAGIANRGALTVANCTILNNVAAGFSTEGGGIFNTGSLTVNCSYLAGNSADFGGGIENLSGTATVQGSTLSGNATEFAAEGGGIGNGNGTLTVSGSTLCNNTGGGIHSEGLGNTLTVIGCTITGNSDSGIRALGGTATIRDTLVSGNSANQGGGILTGGSMTTIIGCTITGNTAPDVHLSNGITLLGQGGGIFNDNGQLTVQHSRISGNSATEGGGIFNVASALATVEVRDSWLTDNSATEGGAIYNAGVTFSGGSQLGALTVSGSTFTGNSAGDSGGSVYNAGTATLQQCTLSGNSAGSGGGGIFNAASGALTIDDSVVLHNVALVGADLDDLGSARLHDSTVGIIGP